MLGVEIWSDVACPWCYIAKRNFDVALESFAHRDQVELVFRSFELAPTVPAFLDGDWASTIARRHNMTVEATRKMFRQIAAVARASGLELDLERPRPGNTHDAHRLLHLAKAHGCQPTVKERFFRATFVDGEAIGDSETLYRLAIAAGLPAGEVRSVLEGDAFAIEVREDEDQAARIGVRSVPFAVVDRRFSLSGAQRPEVIVHALQAALDKGPPQREAKKEASAPVCSATAGTV
jgi:predicted DsbA family dithiol-disulfide isomerase